MATIRTLLLSIFLAPALVSCYYPDYGQSNERWESNPDNDKIVHIDGRISRFPYKNVRICQIGADVIHSDDYYTISVNKGRFYADVPLDPDKVYQLLIPQERHYSAARYKVFFADQDTIQFVYNAKEGISILNPECNNKGYLDFRAERDAMFADESNNLENEYSSIRQYWSDDFNRMARQLRSLSLDDYAKDTVKLLIGQMYDDSTAYTAEARKYLGHSNLLRKKELDFAKESLKDKTPSLACLEIVYESMRSSSDLGYGFSEWLKYYNSVYADLFKDCNLHKSINDIISAMDVYEGMPFIDFTLPDKDGNLLTLSQLIDGKVAILEFWATWCSPCITTRHTIRDVYDRYKDEGFTVVEVAREFRNDLRWRDFIEKDGAEWADLLAMEDNHYVGDEYGLSTSAGGTFLIDREGTVIKINPTREEIEAVLLAQ